MGGGISTAGLLRMANALVKALGGESVSVLLPATAMTADSAGQLGLVDPGVQEVILSPAVSRELSTGNVGPRRRVEFTVAASAVERALPELGMGSADDFFRAALAIKYGGDLFHLEKVVPESFGGAAYFYVLTAVE